VGTDGDPVADVLEHAYRDEWSAVVATLARRLGDLQAAEDAAAEAFAAHADLLERAGRAAEAAAAWARAERAMGNTALQRELHRRGAVAAGDE
jgi:RNA polymerase sigma-70 factor, ECF subfamily